MKRTKLSKPRCFIKCGINELLNPLKLQAKVATYQLFFCSQDEELLQTFYVCLTHSPIVSRFFYLWDTSTESFLRVYSIDYNFFHIRISVHQLLRIRLIYSK